MSLTTCAIPLQKAAQYGLARGSFAIWGAAHLGRRLAARRLPHGITRCKNAGTDCAALGKNPISPGGGKPLGPEALLHQLPDQVRRINPPVVHQHVGRAQDRFRPIVEIDGERGKVQRHLVEHLLRNVEVAES